MKINDTDIMLVVGLGNPGDAYASTYHNVGWLFTDAYLRHHGVTKPNFTKKGSFSFFRTSSFIAVKPNTFMNDSGRALAAALKSFKLKPEQLLVAHDDSDIALGSYKFSFGRGSAGHRGIDSIVSALGTNNFWRLRIGIRQGADARGPYPVPELKNRANPARDKQARYGTSAEQRRKKIRKSAADIVLKPISKRNLMVFHALFDDVATRYPL